MTEPSIGAVKRILGSLTGRPQLQVLQNISDEVRQILALAEASSDALPDLAASNAEQLAKLELVLGSLPVELRSLSAVFADYIGKLRTDVLNQTEAQVGKLQAIEQALQDLTKAVGQLGNAVLEAPRDCAHVAENELSGPLHQYKSPALRPASSLDLFPSPQLLSDHQYGKVVIFGLQKAGNTWLLSLLSEAFGLPAFFNVHDPAQIGQRAIVSTHDPLTKSIRGRSDFVHGVCLIRDLRDMVSSYFHYMQTDSYQRDVPKAKYGDIETFYFDWFLSRMVPAHRYLTYWEEYASAGVPVLRYERLVADTERELERLFARWGEPVDPARLKTAVTNNDFQTLKQRGRQIGQTKIDSSHFRRGGIGAYKEELPQAIIDDINSRFGDVLRRWGYSVP